MPIFDYRCAECSHTFELFVQTSTVPRCPRCESQRLDKLLSRFAVGGQAQAPLAPCGAPCGSCGDRRASGLAPHGPGPGACRLDA